MFRLIAAIAIAIVTIDLAASALLSGRAPVIADWHVSRKLNPVGYWLMTGLLLALALLSAGALGYLVYSAITRSGPYTIHAFFSMHQAWPFGAVALVMLFFAGFKVRNWILLCSSTRRRR